MIASGWSPYDYPADERDKISFDGWKPEKDEETSAKRSTTSKTHSTMAGLESLFSQSKDKLVFKRVSTRANNERAKNEHKILIFIQQLQHA